VIKDYDVLNDEEIIRLDILFGVKVIYPELGVRIWG
jgi:23S rRNA A1618 N6-methylase RlmF